MRLDTIHNEVIFPFFLCTKILINCSWKLNRGEKGMKDTTTMMALKICLGVRLLLFSNTNAQHLVLLKVFLPFYILEQDNFNLPDIEGISKKYFVHIFSLSTRLHENIAKNNNVHSHVWINAISFWLDLIYLCLIQKVIKNLLVFRVAQKSIFLGKPL